MSKPAKPAAAKAPAKKDGEAVAGAPKNNKKMVIIIAAVVLAIGGGAGWYFVKSKNSDHQEVKVEQPKEPKFIALDTFTVNLQREEADQFLQINISLKFFEPELEEKIKAVMPEIKSKLNLLLSSKRASELVTVAGKRKLATDIATEANNVLGVHVEAAAHKPELAATPAVDAHAKPAEGEVHVAEHAEAASAPVAEEHAKPAEGEAPVAVVEAASAPAVVATPAPAHSPESAKKGVVDVLFTSFIIQ